MYNDDDDYAPMWSPKSPPRRNWSPFTPTLFMSGYVCSEV